MTSNDLILKLLQYKAWANTELFTLLQKVDNQETLNASIRILNHIYVVDQIFKAKLTGTSHPYTATNTESTPTLADLRISVRESDDWYIKYVHTLNSLEMNERINFTFVDGDSGSMTRAEILMHIITHGGYHRGAVGRVLAHASVQPPREIFTRFLHETEPDRRN